MNLRSSNRIIMNLRSRNNKRVSKKINKCVSNKTNKRKVVKSKMNPITLEFVNPIVEEVVKLNMNENESYSIALEVMKEIGINGIDINEIQISDFETMSFVCPELYFWKAQF